MNSALNLFPAHAPLPSKAKQFSLLSFNVLLPNSKDGWWIFKYYMDHVPDHCRQWPYRKKLLSKIILNANADIVCLQEACFETFATDFDFMFDAGYSASLLSKGRFRSATFWKQNRFNLISVQTKDRILITAFQALYDQEADTGNTSLDQDDHDRDAQASNSSYSLSTLDIETRDSFQSDMDQSPSDQDSISPLIHKFIPGKKTLFVLNCHLAGGPKPEHRLRQVFDGLDYVRKAVNRLVKPFQNNTKSKRSYPKQNFTHTDLPTRQTVATILCGDFNSAGDSAVRQLLIHGKVEPTYIEKDTPELTVTSKIRILPLSPFQDVYASDFGIVPTNHKTTSSYCPTTIPHPPPTLIVRSLQEKLLIHRDSNGVIMTPNCIASLTMMFNKFSLDGLMDWASCNQWICLINRGLGRGSEYRSALAIFKSKLSAIDSASACPTTAYTKPALEEAASNSLDTIPASEQQEHENSGLGTDLEKDAVIADMVDSSACFDDVAINLDDFLSIYKKELMQGKFWGVAYDMDVCGCALEFDEKEDKKVYDEVIDFIYYTPNSLVLEGARASLSEQDWAKVLKNDPLPNEWHPSDHLPIGAVFRFK